jgi:penicillin-binding protein 1A
VISDGPVNWGGWSPKNYGKGYAGRVTLTTALVKSINTVPVRLAKDHLGIGPIKALAEAMGVESPISSHKTMTLGISGMTVMDQATGYSVFANGGFAGTRHGITQITTHSGEVIYDRAKDAPPPKRVLSEQATASMNTMLVQVPEIGTAKKATLQGIRSAGKTGTTQSYRDAWYVGFTGNYVAAVWLGNDDFTPTNNMTGGSLPAMTWQRLMTYVHQNVELKPIPGIENPFIDADKIAKAPEGQKVDPAAPDVSRPATLSAATTRSLRALEQRFRDAPPVSTPDAETLSAL